MGHIEEELVIAIAARDKRTMYAVTICFGIGLLVTFSLVSAFLCSVLGGAVTWWAHTGDVAHLRNIQEGKK